MTSEMIKFNENDKFSTYLGIELIKYEPGYALAQMKITDHHLNGANIVHGGAIFTLADFAFAAASNLKGLVTLGIDSNISFFKPPKGSMISAEAKEISSHKRLCGYNVEVFDENKDLIARFYSTGYIKDDKIFEV